MDILQDVSGGTKGLTFTKQTCENVYGNTNISKVGHYETTLQLGRASRRNKFCRGENMNLQNTWAWKIAK